MMNEPSSARLMKLVEGLLAQTREGLREWSETDQDFVFDCDTPRAAVRIESLDRDDGPPFRIVVLNSSGKEVESLNSTARGLDTFDIGAFAELYQLAKRSALGADELIDDLFEELGISAAAEDAEAKGVEGKESA
jgi:hypothetical protein